MAHMQDIILECLRLRKTLVQPINDTYYGPLTTDTMASTKYPMVLLLGNHSSGKSAFINHVLGRRVQESGVAPTDDGFTIISPGNEDIDRAGPALIDDPDLGFSTLKNFGPTLVHKTQLKVRKNTKVNDFMIVDSPGMIDSPVKANANDEEKIMDRGYDFESVCKWYGERADLILLFFDPDKPGTTGETLRVLTNALLGLDYKLHIILNKADQFKQISDYARAYGSLCWNLSKVIPRKDLPQIHTMCLPPAARVDYTNNNSRGSRGNDNGGGSPAERLLRPTASSGAKAFQPASSSSPQRAARFDGSPVGTPLRDPVTPFGHNHREDEASFLRNGAEALDLARAEVEMEVFRAPIRRVDNEISRLADSVQALTMHCRVLHVAAGRYQQALWRWRYAMVGATTVTVSLCGVLGLSLWRGSGGGYATPTNTVAAATSKPAATTSSGSGGSAAVAAATVLVSGKTFSVVSGVGAMGLGAMYWLQQRSLDVLAASLSSYESLTVTFRSVYAAQLARGDLFVESLWESVGAHMRLSLTPSQLQASMPVQPKDFLGLERILEYDVANLRRRCSSALASPNVSPSPGPGKGGKGVAPQLQQQRQQLQEQQLQLQQSSSGAGTSSSTSTSTAGTPMKASSSSYNGSGENGSERLSKVTFHEEVRSPVLLSPPPLHEVLESTDILAGQQEHEDTEDNE